MKVFVSSVVSDGHQSSLAIRHLQLDHRLQRLRLTELSQAIELGSNLDQLARVHSGSPFFSYSESL